MALLFTILLAISAAALGYVLTHFDERTVLRETAAAIDLEIALLSPVQNDPQALASHLAARETKDPSVTFRFADESAARPPAQDTDQSPLIRITTDDDGAKHAHAARLHPLPDGRRLIVARDIQDIIASHDRLKTLSWLIMALMLAVVVVSFGISHFVVSRINRIAAIAQNIVHTGDLSQRLSIDSRWDDLSNLSGVLNGFLGKIEDLMNGVRQVSNNIAHDLRTPLSGLRSDIEDLKGKTVEDRHIDALLGEADRILAIFHALLRITNIEKGKRSQHMRAVDIAPLLKDVADLYEPVAEEKDIRFDIDCAADLRVKGDRDLLFQLFANITDNAIKYSPHGATVRFYAGLENGRVLTFIEDRGPGIPAHETDNVFKHFYRVDSSRSTPGNGLGLSLVRAVAEQHQARVVLEDAAPGLRVTVSFQPYE